MANKTITDLTAGTTLDGTEVFHGVQGSNSRKFTSLQMVTPALSATNQAAARASISATLRGHLFGLMLSNNGADSTNDIDIEAGEAASEQAIPLLMVYAGGPGAQLDVAYGSGSGGRFDSSISDGTWHVFLISNGTTVTRGFSKSLDPTGQANFPSGYTHYRRLGSIIRAAGAILQFTQLIDEFLLNSPTYDVTVNNPGTAAVLRTLTVPAGLKLISIANVAIVLGGGAVTNLYVSSPDQTDLAPNTAGAPLTTVSSGAEVRAYPVVARVRTNTSAQIRTRFGYSDANVNLRIATLGWQDNRGR